MEVKISDWKGECEEKDGKYILKLNPTQGLWAVRGWKNSIFETDPYSRFNSLYPEDVRKSIWNRKRRIDHLLENIKIGAETLIELNKDEIYCIYDGLKKWIRSVQDTGINNDFDNVDEYLVIAKDFAEWLRHLKSGGYQATCFKEHKHLWEAECGPWYAMRNKIEVKCPDCSMNYNMTDLCYMLK